MQDLSQLFEAIFGTASPAKKSEGAHCTVDSPATAGNFLRAPFKKRPLSHLPAEPASDSKKLESSNLAGPIDGSKSQLAQIIKCLEVAENTAEKNERLRAKLNKAKEELNTAKEVQVKMIKEQWQQMMAYDARITAAEAALESANAIATAAEADQDFSRLCLKNLKEDWVKSEAAAQAATLKELKTSAKSEAEREKKLVQFPPSSTSLPPLSEENNKVIQICDWDFLRDESENDEGRGRKRKKGGDDDDEWTVECEKGKKTISRSRRSQMPKYKTKSRDSGKLKKDVGKDEPSAKKEYRRDTRRFYR